MKRKLKVCLDILIVDNAIVCRGDPGMDEEVLRAGGEEMYVLRYVRSNFSDAFGPPHDQGAWDNICAYIDPNVTSVEVFPNLEVKEEETLRIALQDLLNTCSDEIAEKQDIPGERKAVFEDRQHLVNIEKISAKLGLKL